MFLRSCVAQALNRGDGSRYSLHASVFYHEYNKSFIYIFLLMIIRLAVLWRDSQSICDDGQSMVDGGCPPKLEYGQKMTSITPGRSRVCDVFTVFMLLFL